MVYTPTITRFPSSSELVVTPETQNVWGGVNYYRSSSAVPIRGGQPASTTFETFNSSVWNTGKTLKGKCETTTTGSGNDIGCSIANMPVGSYRIHASGLMYENLSTNGVTACSYQIYETTTSTQVGVITALTQEPNGGIVFNGRSVDGVFANNSLGTRNFVIRGAKTSDTTTGSASTCRLFVSQGAGEISDFNITITPLDNASNSALYVQGPVKAAATGAAIPAGYQGEVNQSNFSPITTTTNGWQMIKSISLTPGVWLCSAGVNFLRSGATYSSVNLAAAFYWDGTSAPGTGIFYDANVGRLRVPVANVPDLHVLGINPTVIATDGSNIYTPWGSGSGSTLYIWFYAGSFTGTINTGSSHTCTRLN